MEPGANPSILTAWLDEARREEPSRCPNCGSELSFERLVVEDEAGQEALLLIDCPKGDFHVAVTGKDIVEVMTKIVMERLRQM